MTRFFVPSWDLFAEQFERFRHAASVLRFEDEAIPRIERVGDLPRELVGYCEEVPARFVDIIHSPTG